MKFYLLPRFFANLFTLIFKSSKFNDILYRLKNKKLRAFSLLEISIVLAIIGILSVGVFQGQKLVYQAKIEKVAAQINSITTNVAMFQTEHGCLPCDYAVGDLQLSVTSDNLNDNEKFWGYLIASGLIDQKLRKSSICELSFRKEDSKNYIKLSGAGDSNIFKRADALKLQSKIEAESEISPSLDSSNNSRLYSIKVLIK